MCIVFFIVGAVIGSFFNMLLYRLKHKESILKRQRSYCDFCKKPLSIKDKIPIFSFLLNGGKSTCCNKELPCIYLLNEIFFALLFMLNFKIALLFFPVLLYLEVLYCKSVWYTI